MGVLSLVWEARYPRQFLIAHIKRPLDAFYRSMYTNYKQKTKDGAVTLREVLFKAGVVALLTSVVVWISVFMYVAFYYSYMPNVTHSRPVHLQFKSCDEQKGICSFPSSHVELTRKQQLLMVGQPYRVKLVLEMPESPANKHLGMFQCCAELRAKGGVLVSASCRTGILPYRSELLNLMFTLAYSPLFLAGFREEKRTVEVELFSHYEEDQVSPVTDVYVEIQSRYIELYSATLYIDAHFSGLRYIMFHWPMFSAIVGISSNLMFVALVCALSWYHLYSDSTSPEEEEEREYENQRMKEKTTSLGFDSTIGDHRERHFSDGPDTYLFDSEELGTLSCLKEEKKDSCNSEGSSFAESLGSWQKMTKSSSNNNKNETTEDDI